MKSSRVRLSSSEICKDGEAGFLGTPRGATPAQVGPAGSDDAQNSFPEIPKGCVKAAEHQWRAAVRKMARIGLLEFLEGSQALPGLSAGIFTVRKDVGGGTLVFDGLGRFRAGRWSASASCMASTAFVSPIITPAGQGRKNKPGGRR